ncbi:MAG: polyhydroxyalkanoic acid system family protein [Casimicrobiaceae bacterium]
MATIRIDRKHALSDGEAHAAAERLAKDLELRFALRCTWDGDDVRFERPGVNGRMHVGGGHISLDVTLGFLMSAMKPAIEREINAQLDRFAPGGIT